MITILTCALALALLVLVVRWIASAPLVRALSLTIDQWADSVHGEEPGPLR